MGVGRSDFDWRVNVKRYQECNLLVRLYRRLKYQPYYFLKGVKGYIEQLMTKKYDDDDISTIRLPPRFIFDVYYSQWQSKAEWYYTYEEFKEEMESWDEEE